MDHNQIVSNSHHNFRIVGRGQQSNFPNNGKFFLKLHASNFFNNGKLHYFNPNNGKRHQSHNGLAHERGSSNNGDSSEAECSGILGTPNLQRCIVIALPPTTTPSHESIRISRRPSTVQNVHQHGNHQAMGEVNASLLLDCVNVCKIPAWHTELSCRQDSDALADCPGEICDSSLPDSFNATTSCKGDMGHLQERCASNFDQFSSGSALGGRSKIARGERSEEKRRCNLDVPKRQGGAEDWPVRHLHGQVTGVTCTDRSVLENKTGKRTVQMRPPVLQNSPRIQVGDEIAKEGRSAANGVTGCFAGAAAFVQHARISVHVEEIPQSRGRCGSTGEHAVGDYGDDVLTYEKLSALWPCSKTVRSKEWSLPLHVTAVPMIDLAALKALMPQDDLHQFEREYDRFSKKHLDSVPIDHAATTFLCDSDIESLVKCRYIKEVDQVFPKNFVVTFSVTEPQKGRRRWIVYPRLFNRITPSHQLSESVKLQGIDDIIESTHNGYALLSDFASWFPHFPLPEEAWPYFCFLHAGRLFACLRIPTGATTSPNIGQIASWTISQEILRRTHVVPKSVHVFIDNLRFITQTTAQSQALCQSLLQLCQELCITLNEDEMHVGSIDYVFLGVHFSHASDHFSVCLSPKFISKLQQTKDIFAPDATLRDVLQLFGKLQYAARILGLRLAEHYYAFKFLRRRVFCFLDDTADVWPSTQSTWERWMSDVLANVPVYLGRKNPVQFKKAHMITDSSLKGWVAVFFFPKTVFCIGESWEDSIKQHHINVLELFAVERALKKIDLQQYELVIGIDNTTAGYCLSKQRSKNFVLNSCILRISELPVRIVEIYYIESKLNPADWWSREGLGLHTVIEDLKSCKLSSE